MKRTKLNSILAKVVTTSFIFTTLPTAAFAEVVNDNKELVKLQVNIPTVSPTPHNIEGSGEGFILTEKVNIVGQEQADQDAIRELTNKREFCEKLYFEASIENKKKENIQELLKWGKSEEKNSFTTKYRRNEYFL